MKAIIFTLLALPLNIAHAQEAQQHVKKAAQQLREVAVQLIAPSEQSFRIIRYIENSDNLPLVMIAGGKQDGVVEGANFKSYRRTTSPVGPGNQDLWIQTGILKTVQLADTYSIAQIVAQETLDSRTFFPKFPGIMAGDWVMEDEVKIAPTVRISPEQEFRYSDLFVDAKSFPTTFELTEQGRQLLAKAAATFAEARVPTLLIEGYTDPHGPADANQVESLQRAMVIRQYLISEFGFDPTRVIAIGFGENEPKGDPDVPGQTERNRRIVLKVSTQMQATND